MDSIPILSETQEKQEPITLYAPRPTTQMFIGGVVIPIIVVIMSVAAFFYLRSTASTQLVIPDRVVALVRTLPDDSAPLMARFGGGQTLELLGRTEDWRWLEVELWGGQRGWILRPLDILVWQIEADPTTPVAAATAPSAITPVVEEVIAFPETTFTMGSPPGLGEDDERPARAVSLSAFEIDRTEVTIGQYWQCVEASACAAPIGNASQTERYYLNDPQFDNHPVVNVAWTEANNYCQWRGKRLPTEAEWELAAGWDIKKKAKLFWPWGSAADQIGVNVGPQALGNTTGVGTLAVDRSPSGVLDMGGNVSEWVFDWYKVDYYEVANSSDPTGPSPRRGEGVGRAVRGGSFADTNPDEGRVANRRHQAEGYGYPTVGFRCARDR